MTDPVQHLAALYRERSRIESEIITCEQVVTKSLLVGHGDIGRTIQHLVAQHTGLPVDFLTSEKKERHYVQARAAAFILAREYGWSLPRIGAWSQRNHTSVMHAINTKAVDPTVVETVSYVRALLRPREDA